MKKKLLSILLTICMIVSLLPGVALAQTSTRATFDEVFVGKVNVKADNYQNGSIPGMTYDKEKSILTLTEDFRKPAEIFSNYVIFSYVDLTIVLNGCTFDAGDGGLICVQSSSLNLRLIGTNTLTGKNGIDVSNSINVSAEAGGSLDVTSKSSHALQNNGGTIDVDSNVTLNAKGGTENGSKRSALYSPNQIYFGDQPLSSSAQNVAYAGGVLTLSTPLTNLSVGSASISIEKDGTYLDGNASYNASTNTLTLTGEHVATNREAFVDADGDLNVVLSDCTINAAGNDSTASRVEGLLNLTLRGANSLTGADGISATDSITVSAVDKGSLTANLAGDCLYSEYGDIHVQSGNLDLSAQGSAVRAHGRVTFGGETYDGSAKRLVYRDGVLTAHSPITTLTILGIEYLKSETLNELPTGVTFDKANSILTLTDCTLTVLDVRQSAIHADGDLTIVLNNSTLEAGGDTLRPGIEVEGALDLVMNASTIDGKSKKFQAVRVDDTLKLTLKGDNFIKDCTGIFVNKGITVSADPGGTLTAQLQGSQGMYSNGGDIHLQSGTLHLIGKEYRVITADSGSIIVERGVNLTATAGNYNSPSALAAGGKITLDGEHYEGTHRIILYKGGRLTAMHRPSQLTILGVDCLNYGGVIDGAVPLGASYNWNTATLTLTRDFTIPPETTATEAVHVDGTLNLVLDGEVHMESDTLTTALSATDDLNITGGESGGKLTTDVALMAAAGNSLTIDGGARIRAATLATEPAGGKLLVTENSALTLTGATELAEGATLTVEEGASLTLESHNAALAGAGTLSGNGTFTVRHGLQATDITTTPEEYVYTGSPFEPAVTVNDREILGKVFTMVYEDDYTMTYENNTAAGEAYVVFTPKEGVPGEVVKKPFLIRQSSTAFDGGVQVYNGDTATTRFTYGDTITVKVTAKATGEAAPAPKLLALTPPTANQMALYKGNVQISDGVDAVDGVYTMTINTRDKLLDIGSNIITAKYVESTNMAAAEASVTVSLAPKAISSAGVKADDPSAIRPFNGFTSFAGVVLTPNSGDIDTDAVTATAGGTAASAAAGTHAFTATSVALAGDHAKYYTLSPSVVSGDVVIAKAVTTVAPPASIPMAHGVSRDYTFNLTSIALPPNAGTKGYAPGSVTANGLFIGDPTIENGILTVSTNGTGEVGNTATVAVTISSDNYEDITVTLTFSVSAKTPVDISGVAVANRVYNGAPVTMTGTPIAKDGDKTAEIVAFTDTWSTAADGTVLDGAPKDAGDYKLTVSVKPDDPTYTGALELPFSITKAAITVKADNKTAYVGDVAPDPTYLVTGLVKDEVLSGNPTAIYETVPDMTQPGETVITVSGGAVPLGGNYDAVITYLAGKLTVSTRPAPSGGGSTTTETEKQPDGSTTTTVTNKRTGAVTQTTKYPNGAKIIATTAKDGKAELKVTVPTRLERVTVTIPTPEMPAPGQVAVIVHADGTRQVVKTSVATDAGLRVTLTEDATLELIDNAKDFGDVAQDSWYADSIAFASSRELFEGTGNGHFTPEATTTRSMLMTVLYRFSGAEVSSGGEQWYSDALAWSVEEGLSDGTNPEGDISREQLAVILYRFAGSPKTEGSAPEDFPDGDSVSAWATDAMVWAVACGILQGDGTALNPDKTATRAEMATILQRYISLPGTP